MFKHFYFTGKLNQLEMNLCPQKIILRKSGQRQDFRELIEYCV